MRTGRDFYLSWASSQVLASFLSTEKPVPCRLLCHVRGLIPSGIFLLICYNPKMHVPATGIRSLTHEPAPIQITSCQVPPPPMSFSVPRQGMQPPWIETFLPPRAYPQQAGACSLFCSFMEAGRATAYCEDQGLGFPTAMTQRVACSNTATHRDITPSFPWPFQFCGYRTRCRGAGRGEWKTPSLLGVLFKGVRS